MKDYDTTLARMAGNIAGSLLAQFEVRGSEVAVVSSQLQAIAKVSVELARRIVEILRHE